MRPASLRQCALVFCGMACLATMGTVNADDVVGATASGSVYEVGVPSGDTQFLGGTGYPFIRGMTKDASGNYFGYSFAVSGPEFLLDIDPRTGYSTPIVEVLDGGIRGIALSGSGTLYGVDDAGLDGQGNHRDDHLVTIDMSTGVVTRVGTTSHTQLEGLCFDPGSGTLYAWDMVEGLITINPGSGASVDVNPAEPGDIRVRSLAFDSSGDCYGVGWRLFEVDTTTGAITVIGDNFEALGVESGEFFDFQAGCLELEVSELDAGTNARFTVSNAPDGTVVAIVWSLAGGVTTVSGFGGYCAEFGLAGINQSRLVGQGPIMNGEYVRVLRMPGNTRGLTIHFQAAQRNTCPGECVSNIVTDSVE